MERDARQVLSELLVLRAQGGDEPAFAQLYGLWQPDIRRFALVKLSEAGAADEVAQNTWIAIARDLHRLDDPARFAGWAFRIVERRAADYVRRRQKERRDAAVLDAYVEPQQTGPRADDPGLVRLQECIAQLDAPTRELLTLFYQTGLSVGEIADLLGVPSGTVKSRLFAAREQLKHQLERTPS